MKFYPIEQRGDEWHAKRLGRPTASQFHRIISGITGNKAKEPWKGYQAELVAERIFGRQMGRDLSGNRAVQHGVVTEPEAAQALAERIGPFQPGGFFTDDAERYGASPDGLIEKDNRREICEIKSPYELPNHVKTLLYGVGDDHRAQIQGQLWVSESDVCHFWSFHPDAPAFYARVERDDPFMRKLDYLLDEFVAELAINHARALEMGAWRT